MCIIVAKNKGVEMPTKETMKICFDNNPDGAGYMFAKDGNVYIHKGFMTFDSFYKSIEKLGKIYDLKEHSIVMHFRISTGGNVDAGNCHPYPISNNKADVRKTKFVTDLGMAHNGTISDYSSGYSYYSYSSYSKTSKEVLNDTQKFIINCVSAIKEMDNNFLRNPRAMQLISDVAGSKLCFLDGDENIHYVGEFIEDNGVMYSNANYKPRYTYPVQKPYSYGGYGNYARSDKWYDCYCDTYNDSDYKEEEVTKSLNINLILEGQEKPLEQDVFDELFAMLNPLEVGDTVSTDDGDYIVSDENKYYLDPFWNVYYVDQEKLIIGLIAEDVFVNYL